MLRRDTGLIEKELHICPMISYSLSETSFGYGCDIKRIVQNGIDITAIFDEEDLESLKEELISEFLVNC